jgi:hypothetical protein
VSSWTCLVRIDYERFVKISNLLVPPRSVKILQTDHTLIVGQSRTLECEATGAPPKPQITWWKEGETNIIIFFH